MQRSRLFWVSAEGTAQGFGEASALRPPARGRCQWPGGRSVLEQARRCGLWVVDLATGDAVHWVRITGVVSELNDVTVLPKRRPSLIGSRSGKIRRVVSVEGW